MSKAQQSPMPLAGVTVVEMSVWVQGPVAGQILADMGASVTKIERPGVGDFSRGLRTLYGASMQLPDGRPLLLELCNRNKDSICLDLKTDRGQDIFSRLIAEADVFVSNFQPSELEVLGASPEELLEINPRLVYAVGGGVAFEGPLGGTPAQDTVGMAYSGFMYTAGTADGPSYPPGAIADVTAGTNLSLGILAALRTRDATGEGVVVQTSLVQSMLWAQLLNVSVPANTGEPMLPYSRDAVVNPLMNTYKCADDRWIALGIVGVGSRTWRIFCEAVGAPEWADNPHWLETSARLERATEIVSVIEDLFKQEASEVWLDIIRAADLPCSPVNVTGELANDPSVVADGLMAETDDGLRFVRGPVTLAGADVPSRRAPILGEHSAEVCERLGLTSDEIADLFETGVVS